MFKRSFALVLISLTVWLRNNVARLSLRVNCVSTVFLTTRKKLPSIEDRGQTDRMTALPNPRALGSGAASGLRRTVYATAGVTRLRHYIAEK